VTTVAPGSGVAHLPPIAEPERATQPLDGGGEVLVDEVENTTGQAVGGFAAAGSA
jgi:hypothetical protein